MGSIKELTFAADEDKKNHERMQSLIDQLQGKVKSYKKQIEEAEEIAALNLAKYRKVAGALGDAEAAADANEQKRSLPSTWPSIGRLPELWEMQRLLPMLMSRQWPRGRLEPSLPPWDCEHWTSYH